MSNEGKLSLKDKVAPVAAVIAVFTSVLALGRDYIFRFTELLYDGERRVGNKPRQGDNTGLINLL